MKWLLLACCVRCAATLVLRLRLLCCSVCVVAPFHSLPAHRNARWWHCSGQRRLTVRRVLPEGSSAARGRMQNNQPTHAPTPRHATWGQCVQVTGPYVCSGRLDPFVDGLIGLYNRHPSIHPSAPPPIKAVAFVVVGCAFTFVAQAILQLLVGVLSLDAAIFVWDQCLIIGFEGLLPVCVVYMHTCVRVCVTFDCAVCAVCCVCLLYTSPSPRDRG